MIYITSVSGHKQVKHFTCCTSSLVVKKEKEKIPGSEKTRLKWTHSLTVSQVKNRTVNSPYARR